MNILFVLHAEQNEHNVKTTTWEQEVDVQFVPRVGDYVKVPDSDIPEGIGDRTLGSQAFRVHDVTLNLSDGLVVIMADWITDEEWGS